MAEIKVTTQKLRETSNDLQAKKADITRKLDELSELEQKLGTMWEGPAKESFHGAFTQTYNNCKNFMDNAVNSFIVKLDEAASKYDSNELRAAEAASRRM